MAQTKTIRNTQAVKELRIAEGEIEFLLTQIRETVEAGKVADNDADWGHVGTAAHVREQLMQIAIGLAVGPNEDEDVVRGMIEEEMTN